MIRPRDPWWGLVLLPSHLRSARRSRSTPTTATTPVFARKNQPNLLGFEILARCVDMIQVYGAAESHSG